MTESLTHASRNGCYLRLCGVKITCLFTFRQRAQEWVTRNCRIKSRQVLSSSSFFERNETLPEHGSCARRGTIAQGRSCPQELICDERTGEKHRGTETFGALLNAPRVPPWSICDSAPGSEAPEAESVSVVAVARAEFWMPRCVFCGLWKGHCRVLSK